MAWRTLFWISFGLKSHSRRPTLSRQSSHSWSGASICAPLPVHVVWPQKSCSGCSFRAPGLRWHTNDPRLNRNKQHQRPSRSHRGKAVCPAVPWVYTCVCGRTCVCVSYDDERVWKVCAESVQTVTVQVKQQRQGIFLWAWSTALE